MKKPMVLLITMILCAGLLAGCGCQHEWKDATCTAPKTCTLCEETEGEALGHSWADATCEAPKTCTACGETEGEALGHRWADATCEAPKTCSVCAATEGEPLEHTFGDWAALDSETEQRECTGCGYAEQQTIDHLADLAVLLDYCRWTFAGFISNSELVSMPEYALDFQFFTKLNDDGSLCAGGYWGGAPFEWGPAEVLGCEADFEILDYTGKCYVFINEYYPEIVYYLIVTEDGGMELLSLYDGDVFYYEQDY